MLQLLEAVQVSHKNVRDRVINFPKKFKQKSKGVEREEAFFLFVAF